jgi:8-oxo-dGTP pyrophosphatase MutT (NUDIX family)
LRTWQKRQFEERREVARGLVLDDGHRLLLIRWRDPITARDFWEPPGGGRAAGETFEAALHREVAEENGVADIEVGECVAEFERTFIWHNRNLIASSVTSSAIYGRMSA